MRWVFVIFAFAVLTCGFDRDALASTAPAFLPMPPGTIVDRAQVAFDGGNISSPWPVIVSKKRLGAAYGREFYQWYVSIYALRRGAYHLRYASPGNGGPLSRVTQPKGATIWTPGDQDLGIVGAAPLMGRGTQQLVVASHEAAADCGSATVTVFATTSAGNVAPVATLTNFCDLDAKIGADKTAVELNGPYYAANAPLCCPTKPHVTATLRYRGGRWVVSPNYFKVE